LQVFKAECEPILTSIMSCSGIRPGYIDFTDQWKPKTVLQNILANIRLTVANQKWWKKWFKNIPEVIFQLILNDHQIPML
jgi:hypothetical protein